MIYTVLWEPVAERMLAATWNTADDRAAVTAAANDIEVHRRRNAQTQIADNWRFSAPEGHLKIAQRFIAGLP